MIRHLGVAALASLLLSGAAAAQQRYPLWPHGAPGFEARAAIPEQSQDYWTRNVNDPSITAYLPDPRNATGTGIVILPGGGHQLLVTTTEGSDVAHWLADHGIAAFVVRYRLFREQGTPYTQEDARADAERAMRYVRSRSTQFHLVPGRLGVWGFSAGGELARMLTLSTPVPPRGTPDAIDRVSEKPDFAILEFPGPLHAQEHVTADSPPLLLSAANDDACCSGPTVDVFNAYRAAHAPVEMHFYAAGGHAFNLGEDTPLASLQHWPDRVVDWLSDQGLLYGPKPAFVPK